MRSLTTLVLSCLLFAVPTFVRAEESPSEFPLKVHEHTLANGLKVLVVPRKGVPSSPCAITYGVGSVNERVGQTGMAHYLEHMMFKGTKKTGVKDLAVDQKLRDALDAAIAESIRLEDGARTPEAEARIQALTEERLRLIDEQKQNLEINHVFRIYGEAGSTFTNAMTGNDATTYIASLPSEKLELFFWVEADRMRNSVFRQFHAEKDVVREERRMYENRPGALFREEVQRAIYGSHPYAHPILGYHDDLRAMTRAELRAFWATYYAPDNATIYVAGDVEPERIFALAERYFGGMAASTTARPRIPLLRIPKSGEIRMRGRGTAPDRVSVHYRAPAAVTEEALALEFLASYLGDDEGTLSKDLVDEKKTAISVGAGYDGRRYGGTIRLSATLSPTGRHEAVEARVLEAVATLRDAPLSDEAMERLRRRYRARVLGALQNEMRVGLLVLMSETVGSWRDIERDLVRSRTLSADALHQAARQYLVPENRVVTHFVQDEALGEPTPAPTPQPMPRAATPRPLAAKVPGSHDVPESWTDLEYGERPFELPSGATARRVLANGMRAFVVPSEGDPAIRIAARVLGGTGADPEGKEGLAALAAGVLGEAGIPGMSAEALREHLEGIVGSLSTDSDVDGHTIDVTVFPADLDEGLRILGQLLADPQLDAEAFERLRRARLARLENEGTRMRGVTSRLYRRLLWGDVPETRRPTAESLASITLEDVRGWLKAATAPKHVILSISGDFDADAMTQRVDSALGTWTPEAAGVASERAPNDGFAAAKGLHVRPMSASQGSVRIGLSTVPRGHEDAPTLRVLANILSRRIFNTVRSVHGLSYQAGARFTPSWHHDAPFTVTFQTKSESVPFAIHLALEELRKLIAEGPTSEETQNARRGLDAAFRRAFGRGASTADAFAELEAHGMDLGYHQALRDAYGAVTAEAVQATAARYLKPDEFLVLCVGDVEAMKPGDGTHPMTLEDLGPMTVHAAAATQKPTTPSAIVSAMLDALRSSDLEGMQTHTTQAFRKRLADEPERLTRLQMLPQFLGQATVGEPTETIEGDTAEVKVPIQASMGGNPMELVILFELLREGDAWKCETFGVQR